MTPPPDEAKWRFLLQELRALEALAESLYREVGNESTIELHERMKLIKQTLGLDDWS